MTKPNGSALTSSQQGVSKFKSCLNFSRLSQIQKLSQNFKIVSKVPKSRVDEKVVDLVLQFRITQPINQITGRAKQNHLILIFVVLVIVFFTIF